MQGVGLVELLALHSQRAVVAEHEEVVLVHVAHVLVDHRFPELFLVVFDGQENDAVLLVVFSASLCSESVCPFGGLVAPVAVVAVRAVRVPQLDKSVTSGELNDANNGVGVSKDDAAIASVGVIVAIGAALNDIVSLVVLFELLPDFVSCLFTVIPLFDHGGVDEILDSSCRPAAVCVEEVAVELGEGLLEERYPHGFVSAWVCEQGLATLRHQVVINDDRSWDTEGVHVHTVDACFVLHVLRVYKLGHHALWLLSDCGGCRESPAVAERALVDIVVGDAIAEQSLLWESSSCPGPSQMADVLFLHVWPGDGAAISREVYISERFCAGAEFPKIDWFLLEAIKGSGASLADASLGFKVDLGEKFLVRWVSVAIVALELCSVLSLSF